MGASFRSSLMLILASTAEIQSAKKLRTDGRTAFQLYIVDIYIPYTAKLSRGKLLRLCTKHTIHWKTFVVHQAHAIMYCAQQMIQGENFQNWLKNCKNRESFPPRKFCPIRYIYDKTKDNFMISNQINSEYIAIQN